MDQLQFKKYCLHKKLFKIKDNAFLDLFEFLLNHSKNYYIEYSCKINKKKIYPIRFNIHYKDSKNIAGNLKLIFNFFEIVSTCNGVSLNYTLLRKVFKNFNINHIETPLIAGIDIRKKICDSRVKLWLNVNQYPEKINQLMKICGSNEDTRNFILSNNLMFGFDLYFDGRTYLKLYPNFKESHLINPLIMEKLKNILKSNPINFFKDVNSLYLYYNARSFKKVCFDVEGKKIDSIKNQIFLDIFKNKLFKKTINKIISKNFEIMFIALPKNEIGSGHIDNLDIYYF